MTDTDQQSEPDPEQEPRAGTEPVEQDARHDDDMPATGTTSASKGRPIVAGIIGVVAVLSMVLGVVGFWTVDTATDSERFERRVQVLLQDDEISNALADRVVTEVADAINLREAVRSVVPEVLDPAVDLLLAGVRSRVEDRTAELIRSPAVSENVAAAAGRAHAAAVDVIEGESVVDGVTVTDGEVRINLLPLMGRAITAVQEVGLLRNVVVPDLDRGGDPGEQRAALAAALGRDLPEGFGEPVIFRSESLSEVGGTVQVVRDMFVLAKRVFWILLLAGLGLAALSIRLSAQRWRAAAFVVAGLFFMALVFRLVLSAASSRVPDVVQAPGARETVRQIASNLENSFNQTLTWYATIVLLALITVALIEFGLPAWRRRRT